MFNAGGIVLKCAYCFGTVKVIDSFQSVQTVECLSCGVRYDVRVTSKMYSEGVDTVFIKPKTRFITV